MTSTLPNDTLNMRISRHHGGCHFNQNMDIRSIIHECCQFAALPVLWDWTYEYALWSCAAIQLRVQSVKRSLKIFSLHRLAPHTIHTSLEFYVHCVQHAVRANSNFARNLLVRVEKFIRPHWLIHTLCESCFWLWARITSAGIPLATHPVQTHATLVVTHTYFGSDISFVTLVITEDEQTLVYLAYKMSQFRAAWNEDLDIT